MHPSTALARVLVDELVRCGLTDAVLAPGSRSAPLAMALYEGAQAVSPHGLRLHVRIDERSAGYLALGLAKGSGRPAAVLCTSGTAAANLHPAVVEADHGRVPLLVLTADRPPELRDTGANQTIDQIKMYGDAVRWFCEVGTPHARPGMVAYWRSLACRAWAVASGPDTGPVHLNLSFPEPLVPDGDPDHDKAWPEDLHGRASGRPWTRVGPEPATTGESAVPAALSPDVRRGVLVAGDGAYDPAPCVAAARAAGWPVLAEPSSNARQGREAISAYHFLLSTPDFVAAHRPDVVVTVGKPGLSRPLLGFLRDAPDQVVVDPGPRWADPTRSATDIRPAVAGAAFPPSEPGWMESWLCADEAACRAVDAVLDRDDVPSEPRLARDLAAAVPDGALLLVGSSMPIRDLDQTMRPRRGLRILANRGASGVDGLVSTAVGAALTHDGPAYALLGDLALLHDHNGLVLGPEELRPDLAIVVVNNDGGGIFSLLPQAAHPGPFERVFGTPHGVDLAALAAAPHVPYARLTRMSELPKLIDGKGLRLIEVRTDREENAALHARLRAAVAAALEKAGLTRTG
ncbi:MAG: 2-succinyl-5-enolpyruvyl-6-hydroxy-3-cyclohexene-1-carboxylic-acid synthase [Streptosporangiales bacterium]|nr:2-succinyl-5-enolpyruvyl-6-hydroxy-3-cyclohexene-1-carboxylic-acid synthase [Streptosporangiales bacterium]